LRSTGCHVNVQDVAALHVAATLDPMVISERLFAWAEPFSMNIVLNYLRCWYPNQNFPEDIPSQQPCLVKIGNESRVLHLLKKWAGRDNWISLEQGIHESLSSEP
jgi:hypothetical protein